MSQLKNCPYGHTELHEGPIRDVVYCTRCDREFREEELPSSAA